MNNYIDPDIVSLVEKAAQTRGDKEIPKEFIIKALEKINLREKDVPRYPGGRPSLKAVYEFAAELMQEH
jgi:hypothetical protein